MVKSAFKPKKILWIDLEMTGLDPAEDRILEIAAIVTDWDFTEIASYTAVKKVGPNLMKTRMVGTFWDSYPQVRDALMNQNDSGERYILVSETVPFPEVAALVRTRIGKKPAGILPKWVLYAGYILNLLLGWLIPALRMLNKVNLESITGTRIVSNVKIRERLNTSFIPVRESLEFHLNNYLSDHPEL